MSQHSPTLPTDIHAQGLHFAIAVSRWNQDITGNLKAGALECFRERGVEPDHVDVYECPGAFELPLVVQTLAITKRYDAVIAIGAVIRGDTPHFEYVAGSAATGIAEVALTTGVPCIFGVLTVNTLEQAQERAVEGEGNKGREAAEAAIEMALLLRSIQS